MAVNILYYVYQFSIIGVPEEENVDDCPKGAFGDCGEIDYPGRLLYDLYPQLYKDADEKEGSPLRALLDAIDYAFALAYKSVAAFTCIIDPDAAPAQFLEHFLLSLGDPFGYVTQSADCTRKRKIVKSLTRLYKYKGTVQGVEYALNLLLGLRAKVKSFWRDCWKVGETEMGNEDFVLAPASTT